MTALRVIALWTTGVALLLGYTGSSPPSGRHFQPAFAGSPSISSQSPRKIALIVGINYYPHLASNEQLNGPINDAVLLARTLQTPKFGFKPEDIHLLISPRPGAPGPKISADVQMLPGQVTHQAILNGFRKYLVNEAHTGDILFFAYSGHGSLWFDPQSPTRQARTLVPTDSRNRRGYGTDILTVELAALVTDALARQPQSLTMVFDSCYSGSRIRGRLATARGLPSDRRRAVATTYRNVLRRAPTQGKHQAEASADRSFFVAERRYVLLAAAREDQLAYEDVIGTDGRVQGLFTQFLVDAMNSSATTANTTYQELFEQVAARVSSRTNGIQLPVLEGQRDMVLFGGQVRDLRHYLVVGQPLNTLEPMTVTLPAGREAGVTVGSLYDIYPENDFAFSDPARKLGTVEIITVNVGRSLARATSGKAPTGAHAVERIHARSVNLRIRVLARNAPRSFTQTFLGQLRASPFAFDLTTGPAFDAAIAEDPNRSGYLRVELSSGEPLGGSFAARDPETPLKLATNLRKYAHVRLVASLENPASRVRFSAAWKPVAGTPPPRLRTGYPVLRVFSETEGDLIAFTVANGGTDPEGCPLYAAIINIAADGAVIVVPEHSETGEKITSQSWREVRFKMVIPRGMRGLRRGQEIFKVVVSTRPINLRWLEQTGYLRQPDIAQRAAPSPAGCDEDWAAKDFIFWVDRASR